MTRMAESSCKGTFKPFLESENPAFEDIIGTAKGPRVIPYQASVSHESSEEGSYNRKSSICGLAGLNYIRLVWELEAEGFANAELLRRLISQLMIDDAMKIISELESNVDVHIEDLLKVPIFEEAVTAPLILNSRAFVEPDGLKNTLSVWFSRTPKNVQAAVFSRSQEIIICLRVPLFDSAIYALLDSHPRADHPAGPALTLTKELDDIITCVDSMSSKTQITHNSAAADEHFSVYCLASKPDIHKLDIKDLLARSVAYLSKRSTALATSEHIALLRSRAEQFRRKSYLTPSLPDSPYAKVQTELQSMSEPRIPTLDPKRSLENSHHRNSQFPWQWALLLPPEMASPADAINTAANEETPLARTFFNNIRSVAVSLDGEVEDQRGGEDTVRTIDDIPTIPDEDHSATHIQPPPAFSYNKQSVPTSLDRSAVTELACPMIPDHAPDPPEEVIMPALSPTNVITGSPDDSWQSALARQLQEEEELSMILSRPGLGDAAWLVALQKIAQAENIASTSTTEGGSMLDWQLAVQLQQEVDITSINLDDYGRGRDSSSSFATIELPPPPESFECGVCGDLLTVAVKISLPDCQHTVCKDCLIAFTSTKIDEGRYPIFCPECMVERPRATIRTQVSEDIIQHLGIPEGKLIRFQELQLVSHCINIQCPRCKETMNVDRTEFSEHSVLVCPLPRCGHKWCKSCLKTLASSQVRHRCKNGNIERLMRRKGWKYCPGCRTPVQKEAGCNHMTCGTPGCNAHFCYKCGVLMIDTTNGGDVGTAVTDHYNECRLFDRRWKCSIQ